MKPGRELDALIAEKVMGLEVVTDAGRYLELMNTGGDFFGEHHVATILVHNETFSQHRPGSTLALIPRYSTNIAAAWEVVKVLVKENRVHSLVCNPRQDPVSAFTGKAIDNPREYTASGVTAEHAICLAALRAVGAL